MPDPTAYKVPLGGHPEDLGNGRVAAPGEAIPAEALTLGTVEDSDEPTHDQRLVDDGRLIEALAPAGSDDGKLTGAALDARVDELGIDASQGGSNADGSMNADEKRAAVAEAENNADPEGA